MDYRKVAISISPYEEWLSDVLMAELANIGYDSFAETGDGFEAYIQADSFHRKDVDKTLETYSGNFTFTVEEEFIKGQNWNEVWEKNYFQPLVIGRECLVRAPFHKDFPKCRFEIVIEPNMAFGTGNHETTSMMLEAILKENPEGKKVLDMGSGTGILSILASMKGASEVTAIDIDEWAVKGSMENAVRNNIKNITVLQGDASLIGNGKYDFVFANIQRNVLLRDIPAYSAGMNSGGKLLVSGFYLDDLEGIKHKALESGFMFNHYMEKNKWVAAVFDRQ